MRMRYLSVLALLAITCCNDDGDASGPGGRNQVCAGGATCNTGLACVAGTCRESCGASYYSTTACGADEYCAPFAGELTGFCVESECGESSDCGGGKQVCAQLKDQAGACVTGCTATFSGGSYTDDCPGDDYCQAMGRNEKRRLVCLPGSSGGQQIGTFCNAIDQPCATNQSFANDASEIVTFGLTCVNSQCIELCDGSAPSPATNASDCGGSTGRGATYCCAQLGAEGLRWGICIPFGGSPTCDPYLY